MTSAFAHLGSIRTVEAADRAPREFAALGRAVDWINSPPLKPEHLAGKVVLVNFWTYTCINWLRTLPYVRAWAQKYQQQFVVVGVHTPEFAFEQNIDNVRRAVRQMNIEYPVAIDNEYAIWRTFDNHSWPALYFVDARGRVRGHRFGEGEYDQSEQLIQRMLAEAGAAEVGNSLVPVDASGVEAPADWSNLKSPENYVGYERTENFASPGGAASDRRRHYAAPPGWRSINGRWLATGPWASRLPSRPVPTAASCTAFTRATCISSWDRHGKAPQFVSASRSTGSRQALHTARTWTTAATARLSNSGCTS